MNASPSGFSSRDNPHPHESPIIIVGVGASAGGLEALEQLFECLPADSGLSFVVVQHLSPDFKSHMVDLLARHTKMPVSVVEDGMLVEANRVYLIPPKMEMIIADGRLLLSMKGDRQLSHPIDQFLRSLASDFGERSVGVILSGTGSDGSRGIVDIHAAGGLVLAQDPESARFDGMPASAAATGVVDYVEYPKELADLLVEHARMGLVRPAEKKSESTWDANQIFGLLDDRHGLNFSNYKSSTVTRRLERRMELRNLETMKEYVDLCQSDVEELEELYRDLLIGVTKFFRDQDAFAQLAQKVIPAILDGSDEQDAVRVWVCGCATGEEAYSIAILIDEELKRRGRSKDVRIFATDAHHGSLQFAARGVYDSGALEDMDAERLDRYFTKQQDGYHVNRELRRSIVFAPHNVTRDAPFTQMDLVSCRNLLIYLLPAAQKKALSLFHFALRSGGHLFLGPSESTGDVSDEFEVIDKRWRLFRKRRDIRLPLDARATFNIAESLRASDIRVAQRPLGAEKSLLATYDRLLDRKMPPSVLVSEAFEIQHVFGGAEKYLTLRGGRPTTQLPEIIRSDLKPSVVGALQHSVRKQDIVRYTGVRTSDGETDECVDITVEPITDNKAGVSSLLIGFRSSTQDFEGSIEEIAADSGELSRDRVATLESELRFAQENLQATIEEMETANEELQATNEELVASNEELHSTNEELHSVNEELYSVNAEHQHRVEELAVANDDMENLLATTRVGVIFLDRDLCIRRYTPEIARLLHLAPQDIGRSIEGFTHYLQYENLIEILYEVIEKQRERELEVTDRFGNAFLLRSLPYRSGTEIDGVVLTLIDVRRLKETQTDLERYKFMAEAAMDGIALVSRDGAIVYANKSFGEMVGRDSSSIRSLGEVAIDLDRGELAKQFGSPDTTIAVEMSWVDAKGGRIPVEVHGNIVEFGVDRFLCIFVRDVSERHAMAGQLFEMGKLVEASSDAIIIWEFDGGIISWNRGARTLYGYSQEEAVGKETHQLLKTVHPIDWDEIELKLRRTGEWTGTISHTAKDGKQLKVSSRHQLVESNGSIRILEINRDITVEERARKRLEKANKVAKQASRAKSEFLTNMSHELRTPMTAMLGFADMLRMESNDPSFQERVDTIKRNGEYLLALINDILDLSKIEAGKINFESERVGVVNVIEDVRSLMGVRAIEEGIPLHFNYNGKVPRHITGDRIRIRQILVNLIGNALKFTDEGQVNVNIEFNELEGSPTCLQIEVEDSGIGIASEDLHKLFSPFSQVARDNNRKRGGTGLGLSISKRLAERMNADISVRSTVGSGSVFTLHLPVSEGDFQELIDVRTIDEPKSRRDLAAPDLVAIESRILLADDRRDVWRVAKYFLEKGGATVQIAEDGRQAVDMAVQAREVGTPFEVILMDMQMPVMNGREAVQELRKLGFETPIVALTADAMEGERDSCIAIGCNEYSPKPIDGPSLLRTIRRLLDSETESNVKES